MRKHKSYKLLCIAACVGMVMLSVFGRIIIIDKNNKSLSLITGEKTLQATMGEDLVALAEEFRDATDAATQFLADPDDTINTGWFQVVSQRNCYVVWKVIPSSKSTVDDWYARYESICSFDAKSGSDIEALMEKEGIAYVLVDADNYPKMAETGHFSEFMHSPSDAFRIYSLN